MPGAVRHLEEQVGSRSGLDLLGKSIERPWRLTLSLLHGRVEAAKNLETMLKNLETFTQLKDQTSELATSLTSFLSANADSQ